MFLNRLLYSALFIIAFIFVYFYGGRIPYMLFYSLLLIPLLSFAYTFLTFRRFEFGQEISKHTATKGTDLDFKFFLTNDSPFFLPFIKIGFFATGIDKSGSVEDTYSLLPGAVEHHSVKLPCRYRGRYDIGIEKIEVRDLLGIISFNRPIPQPHYVIVYPRIIGLNHFRISEAHVEVEAGSSQSRKNSSNSVVSDIREYRYGDSMRKIHWKLSSKANKLMVKNYEGASEASVTVFLDLCPQTLGPYEKIIYEDKLIEAAVAVVNYCVGKNTGVKVFYQVDHLVETRITGSYEFNLFLGAMAEVPFTSRVNVSRLLTSEVRDTIHKTDLVIITGALDNDLYESICSLGGSGHNVLPVYISPKELTGEEPQKPEEIIARLANVGITTYKMHIKDDIKSILEE